MKMSNHKFIAIATTLGLSVGLLAGCSPNISNNDERKRSGTSGGAVIVPPVAGSSSSKSSSSLDAVGGSKGVGSVKGGGAGS